MSVKTVEKSRGRNENRPHMDEELTELIFKQKHGTYPTQGSLSTVRLKTKRLVTYKSRRSAKLLGQTEP